MDSSINDHLHIHYIANDALHACMYATVLCMHAVPICMYVMNVHACTCMHAICMQIGTLCIQCMHAAQIY